MTASGNSTALGDATRDGSIAPIACFSPTWTVWTVPLWVPWILIVPDCGRSAAFAGVPKARAAPSENAVTVSLCICIELSSRRWLSVSEPPGGGGPRVPGQPQGRHWAGCTKKTWSDPWPALGIPSHPCRLDLPCRVNGCDEQGEPMSSALLTDQRTRPWWRRWFR